MSSLSSNSRSQSSIAVAATYDSSAENFILGLQAGAELGGVPPDMFLFCADTAPGNDTVFYHGFNAGALVTF